MLEHIRKSANLSKQVAIGQRAAIFALVGLVDNGRLVGVLDCVAVNAVIGGIQLSLHKPCVVAMSKATGVHGMEIPLPCQELTSHFAPEFIGLRDRLLIELLIFLETCSFLAQNR
jgi:hypothetical protein